MPDPRTYHLTTLGCPKNAVDSDKLEGLMQADGLVPVDDAETADVVIVNTCAFVEEARAESIETILDVAERKPDDADLIVTGCLAERYGAALARELPEVRQVAGFGTGLVVDSRPVVDSPPAVDSPNPVPVTLGPTRRIPDFDLLNLPRPRSPRPWAYVKIAEGCDRACGFCAIPSFRGPQRSRNIDDIVAEVDQLDVAEIVLVAQDLASFGRDQGVGDRSIVQLVREVGARVPRVRLLYLYPSDLDDALIGVICETGVPYFDLSLQHVSRPLLRKMRRWGDGERFLERLSTIRRREPDAAFRSNFIVGYPGETEADHDRLLAFVGEAQLDWCGFFAYSEEPGTYSVNLDGKVDAGLRDERLAELREFQDTITAARRDVLVGREVEVLVDQTGAGRTHREAPEIDGIISVPHNLAVGTFATLTVRAAVGPDLEAA